MCRERGGVGTKNTVGKRGKSMSNERPRMDVTAAGDLREYHVSSVSILQSVLHVRWQSRLGYAWYRFTLRHARPS